LLLGKAAANYGPCSSHRGLAANRLLWLTVTLGAYIPADRFSTAFDHAPAANPVLIAVILIVLLLRATETEYPTYFCRRAGADRGAGHSHRHHRRGLRTRLMNLLGLKDFAARGFAAGLAGHGIGTARVPCQRAGRYICRPRTGVERARHVAPGSAFLLLWRR
jgi:hypothetical protein